MTFDDFCHKLSTLDLGVVDQALALLWFYDEEQPDIRKKTVELVKVIYTTGLGNPNQTRLTEALRKSSMVVENGSGFALKSLARAKIRDQLKTILGPTHPKVDQDLGYLPKPVWTETRGYIEKVCEQLNGCFQFTFYDGASVLVRRLMETLIIEGYETLQRESEIKDIDGNYLMLSGLVSAATGAKGINLGRDAKRALAEVKELGDRSAHNRRFNATKPDLEKIQSGVRVAADELINIAKLRRPLR